MRSRDRLQCPTECRNGSRFSISPRSSSWPRMRSSASACVSPANSPASSDIRPSRPITIGSGRPWSRPISQSMGSWPGVILTAPVPNSGWTRSSAMIGTRRSASGTIASLPNEVSVALVFGVHGHRDVGEHRRRPHGRDRHEAVAFGERIPNPGQRVVDLEVVDLEIGDGALTAGAPVHDPRARGRCSPCPRGTGRTASPRASRHRPS